MEWFNKRWSSNKKRPKEPFRNALTRAWAACSKFGLLMRSPDNQSLGIVAQKFVIANLWHHISPHTRSLEKPLLLSEPLWCHPKVYPALRSWHNYQDCGDSSNREDNRQYSRIRLVDQRACLKMAKMRVKATNWYKSQLTAKSTSHGRFNVFVINSRFKYSRSVIDIDRRVGIDSDPFQNASGDSGQSAGYRGFATDSQIHASQLVDYCRFAYVRDPDQHQVKVVGVFSVISLRRLD